MRSKKCILFQNINKKNILIAIIYNITGNKIFFLKTSKELSNKKSLDKLSSYRGIINILGDELYTDHIWKKITRRANMSLLSPSNKEDNLNYHHLWVNSDKCEICKICNLPEILY